MTKQEIKTISDIPIDYQLITDSQEVKAICNVCGWTITMRENECDSLFVKQSEYGYEQAFGFSGIVPLLNKSVIELPC